MSCMMTNDREIATLAEYVAAILSQAEIPGTIEGVKRIRPPKSLDRALDGCRRPGDWYADPARIYFALYDLNERAYNGRYRETTVVDASPRPMPCVRIDERDDTRRVWMPRLYNLLRFYVYQCAEDATDKDPLYLALCELQDKIAAVIANTIAADMGLSWGEF